ncbi:MULTISPECIES: hypothetical protein [unclassified Stenotrophomonas]|uniref:hypothetical protein n=1 Tax=unclassified Stenotrophomonas TaxID=196198 RepID=UPI003BF7D4E1
MKPASKFVLATAAFTVTGVALACTVLPMLPFSISVDLKDIAAAKQAGASSADAPNRAFLKKLDETAEGRSVRMHGATRPSSATSCTKQKS